jgi:exodeoxyribonuclease-1
MTNFVFYDTETTGKDQRDFIQVIQVASILTNSHLEQLNDMDLSCRPLPWTLVTAGALLTNKKYDTFNNPTTHYEMTRQWFDVWSKWCAQEPATFVTYNGLFFDEEIIRRQFYWNLINPYITNTNGNARLDLLPKMYVLGKFYADKFTIPQINNKPSYKLELLAKSLGMNTAKAHDALADCIFLLELQKLIKDIAPNFYQEIISSCSKTNHKECLINNVLHLNVTRFGNYYPFTALSSHMYDHHEIPIFNLNFDPYDYIHMSLGELESVLFNSKDSPIKWIKLGKTQSTVAYNSLKNDGVDLVLDDNYLIRAEQLNNNQNFVDKLFELRTAQEIPQYDNSCYEQQLYSGGFPSNATYDAFNKFHQARTLDEKLRVINLLPEQRYKDFAWRICSQSMPGDVPQNFIQYCHNLIDQRFNQDGPWPNATKELSNAKELLNSVTDQAEKACVKEVINNIEKNLK